MTNRYPRTTWLLSSVLPTCPLVSLLPQLNIVHTLTKDSGPHILGCSPWTLLPPLPLPHPLSPGIRPPQPSNIESSLTHWQIQFPQNYPHLFTFSSKWFRTSKNRSYFFLYHISFSYDISVVPKGLFSCHFFLKRWLIRRNSFLYLKKTFKSKPGVTKNLIT